MNRLTEQEERRRRRMWEAGMTDGQIAEECCVVREAIILWRKRRGLKCNSEGGRPTRIDREEVIRLIRGGYSNSVIAAQFGCSKDSISYIRRRYA